MKAENIRFVTRGLGGVRRPGVRRDLVGEEPSSVAVGGVDDLADGIATMAASLKSTRLRG